MVSAVSDVSTLTTDLLRNRFRRRMHCMDGLGSVDVAPVIEGAATAVDAGAIGFFAVMLFRVTGYVTARVRTIARVYNSQIGSLIPAGKWDWCKMLGYPPQHCGH